MCLCPCPEGHPLANSVLTGLFHEFCVSLCPAGIMFSIPRPVQGPTAVQGLSCLIELWLPWGAESSDFVLRGEFCKPRYITEKGGKLDLKVCVKEREVKWRVSKKGLW